MTNKSWSEYLMHCFGTNILHSFSLLKKLKHSILFSHFYLIQNDFTDLLTLKGSHFLSENILLCLGGWSLGFKTWN